MGIENPEIKVSGGIREANGRVAVLIGVLQAKKLAPPKPPRWYDRLWTWANGKKFGAGVTLMIAGGVLFLVPGYQLLGKGVFTAGSGLATVGGLHKLLKAKAAGPDGKFGNRELIELAVQAILLAVEIWKKLTKRGA
jgi:hypothetical protein